MIVFGSTEAKEIVKKDRETFGPRDKRAEAHDKLHRYKIEAEATVHVITVHYIWAHSESAAKAQWEQTQLDVDGIDEVLFADDWGEETISDLGEKE